MIIALFIFLFLISVFALITKKHTLYGFLFTLFSLNGLYILPASAGGLKLTHLSFAFTLIFCLSEFIYLRKLFRIDPRARKLVFLLLFFAASILFSIIHYSFPVLETILTGLRYFTFTSFFVYLRISRQGHERLFHILFYVTLITAILYSIQCITGQQLLFAAVDAFDRPLENGLYRFYNMPPLNEMFLLVAIFFRQYLPKRLRIIAPLVFLLPILLSNGRGAIAVLIIQFILVMVALGLRRKHVIGLILVGGIFISLQEVVFSRMDSGGRTSEDIAYTLKGEFDRSGYQSQGGYTLLYRIAWINERWQYLSERPYGEMLFGLGMLPDEHPYIQQKYKFKYGLLMEDSQLVAQLRTPDIAWGNFLTSYGLLGTTLFFIFYFSLLIHLWRIHHPFARTIAVYMIVQLISSMTSISISEPYNLAAIFLFYGLFRRRILPPALSK